MRIVCWLLCFWTFAGYAAVVPGDDFNANAQAAAATLQQWYNQKGLWDTTGWWNAANCVEALEDVIAASNGQACREVLANTFERNGSGSFLNEYYDDEGWWALAWLRAYDLTGDARYLEMAKTIFHDMIGGWTATCGGGVQWKKDRAYKNAIPNELFLLVAIRLHQRTPGDTGPGSYYDWALKEWTWFKNSGMLNAHNLINDGLNRRCENNGRTTWSYNQGVIIGGLVELYQVTRDTNYLHQASAIADATIATLVDASGVLHEPCESGDCPGGDTPQFKGIFIRYLAGLYDVTRQPAYFDFLFRNAHSVWFNDRDEAGHLGLKWNGPFDFPDGARHSSAMFALTPLAEPVTPNLFFAKGAGSAAFNHSVGVPTGTLAWTCNCSNAPVAGCLLSGPYLSGLPAGPHVVHFRLAVNSLNSSPANLVRLEVHAADEKTALASRQLPWNQFAEADQPQDFALHFTNAAIGHPLEFRAYWHRLSSGPSLTVTDVTIDGGHNWTAANLDHSIGRLDGFNAWEADPIRDHASGYLVKGPATRELPAGNYSARFELKVDNFNCDNAKVAILSIVDTATDEVVASRELIRSQFSNILYQTFPVAFTAVAGKSYDFRTYWCYGDNAPRLTQRSLVITKSAT